MSESLLDDKDGTLQDAASTKELVSNMALASGGAFGSSFPLTTLGSKIRTQHL